MTMNICVSPVVGLFVYCCLDPLPATLLKEHFDLLLPSICRTVNLSLESGHLPSSLKSAVLTPLLKKPDLDHEVLSNFRPISNLKAISKVIEKVVAVCLQVHVDSNQLTEPLQSAYKPFQSCETTQPCPCSKRHFACY